LPKDIADAATQLNAWLTTMHAGNESDVNADTLLPTPGTQQPLLKSFSSKNKGSSAAPVRIGATLAEGGMGVVKFAEQKALGRTVVIKTMREDYALSSAEHILREAWATGALEHPNIVPVHDVRVSEDGAPMIVLAPRMLLPGISTSWLRCARPFALPTAEAFCTATSNPTT
jgi:serine/threonine protein kinase